MLKDIKYHILSSHPTRLQSRLIQPYSRTCVLFHFIAPKKQMAQLNVKIITCLSPLLSDLSNKHQRWHEFCTVLYGDTTVCSNRGLGVKRHLVPKYRYAKVWHAIECFGVVWCGMVWIGGEVVLFQLTPADTALYGVVLTMWFGRVWQCCVCDVMMDGFVIRKYSNIFHCSNIDHTLMMFLTFSFVHRNICDALCYVSYSKVLKQCPEGPDEEAEPFPLVK